MENMMSCKLFYRDGSLATKSLAITQVKSKSGQHHEQIWINDAQYFEPVSERAWRLFIGGYQPAKKWLNARKNKTLTPDELQHFSKIIAILEETVRIMSVIDGIEFLPTKGL